MHNIDFCMYFWYLVYDFTTTTIIRFISEPLSNTPSQFLADRTFITVELMVRVVVSLSLCHNVLWLNGAKCY